MVMFGTSVAQYNKKTGVKKAVGDPAWGRINDTPPSSPGKPQGRDVIGLPTGTSRFSFPTNSDGTRRTGDEAFFSGGRNTPAGGSAKSAVSGGTAFSASGILNQDQNPVANNNFLPTYSGIRQKAGNPAMGRLGAINETTDILNEGMNNRIAARNDFLRRRNAMQSSVGDSNPTAGAEFYGIGDASGSGLDPEQMNNARQIADVGRQRGMGDQAIRIAIMTSLAESGLRNLTYGDRDSVGLFQQRTSQGWGTVSQIMNPTYSAGKFYDTLKTTNWQGMSPWQAAQAVQRSFDPSGSNYQRQWELANRGFNALSTTPKMAPKANAAGGFINAYNNKYVDYDGAYGAQCVDLYNMYTARFVGGQNIMVGFAPELINKYDTKAYTRLGANNYGHMGDVAIFGRGGATPAGHVAIVVGDNGNGTLRVLHANATAAGPRGNTIISNISKASLMGYLRPNKLMGR